MQQIGSNTAERGTDLVIASNRGPVEYREDAQGRIRAHRGAGGLIAVLGPAVVEGHGVWVAAALTPLDRVVWQQALSDGRLLSVELSTGTALVRIVDLPKEVLAASYGSISTETLWFLHHHLFDITGDPVFGAEFRVDWRAYQRVNDEFASACAEEAAPRATVLVQDYHLALAPALLRERRPDVRIVHFTMSPWADADYFRVLPRWAARQLVDGMLGADVLGFLSQRWAHNFLACCRELGYEVVDGSTRGPSGTRWTTTRVYPVGVEIAELERRARQPDVVAHVGRLQEQAADQVIIARVDRMEPSKNILRGLQAYDDLLAGCPELHGRVVHHVLAYSSRETLPAYRRNAADVRTATERINDRYGHGSWQPIVLHTDNDFAQGIALLSIADVVVVNPLRDGMNLVAKECPAVNQRDCALILSRDAGAVDDVGAGALVVDPLDTAALTAAMSSALSMSPEERRRRMAVMRRGAGALPPTAWLRRVLADVASTGRSAERPPSPGKNRSATGLAAKVPGEGGN